MSTQRKRTSTRMSASRLTIAAGLGLVGAAGYTLMSSGSTGEPFAIQEAMAGDVDAGVANSTWGNGITGEQFRKYGTLLCATQDLKLSAELKRFRTGEKHVASPVFDSHMKEPGFRSWFRYAVRDGAPSGTEVIGTVPFRFKRGDSTIPVSFKGEGGLTFDWLSAPLRGEKRGVVLGAMSAFINDNGPYTIARICSDCAGKGDVVSAGEAVGGGNPKMKETRGKGWIRELAFVGGCGRGNAPVIRVFWSEELRSKLGLLDKIGGHIQERMCSRAYDEQNLSPTQCPFEVVGSMESKCKVKQDKGMTCNVNGHDMEAAYTFIDSSVTVDNYRLLNIKPPVAVNQTLPNDPYPVDLPIPYESLPFR